MGTNRTLIASQGVTSPSVARSRVMHVSELCYTNNHRIMGMSMDDCIRSCHMIPQLTGSYRMRIYERDNFGGQMHELSDDCDSFMERYRMSDCQSCNVMDGHWLMYEQANYRGRMMYMRPGEYRSFRDMGFNNKH